jgi:hypothetical protein
MNAPNTPTLFDGTGIPIPPSIVPTTPSEDPAIAAFGTLIQVLSATGPDEFTTINGVGDITGPNTNVAEVETTSHSTGKPHKTFQPTLIDDGDLAFPCYFNPSDPTHSLFSPFGLENLFQNRAVTEFQLVNTDPARRTRRFRGFVKQLSETYPVAGVCTRATTIRISSVPTDVLAAVTLVPTSLPSEPAAGGSHTIAVTSTDTIGWLPVSDSPWITIVGPTTPTVGDGTVSYTIAASVTPTPARDGNITVGDQTFAIHQAAGV